LPAGYSPPTACRHTVAGTLSLPSQGCFSPFPHGTGSLSVANEYLALRDGPRSFPRDFTCPAVLRSPPIEPDRFRLQDCHLLWSHVPEGSTIDRVSDSTALRPDGSYNPGEHALAVWALPRSLAATCGITDLFSLPGGTEMVHFPPLPSCTYGFSAGCSGISRSGFPHSEIPGSKPACGSPRLIAACHVLHRLLAPRHSPYALSSLTKC
jgi:hypothetical protein